VAANVAHGVDIAWPVEIIPDADTLLMCVHFQWFDRETGELYPGCFKNLPDEEKDGMSTEWDKYSSAQAVRGRKGNPEKFGAIAIPVSGVRSIPEQRVEHDPLPGVRAHTLVWGPKGREHPKIRLAFRRIAIVLKRHTDPFP
jgi:hypothetical protein